MLAVVMDEVAPTDMVVGELLRTRASAVPDRPFLHFAGEPAAATFGTVAAAADRNAAALHALEVRAGEPVALMMPNSVAYVELYFGLAHRGAPVVLVNTAFRGYMLEYVLNDSGCRTLVVDAAYLPTVLASADQLSTLEQLVVVGDTSALPEWRERFARLRLATLDPAAPAVEPARVSHTDLHCVVYSSGTTGPSKGIMISHAHAVVKAIEVIRICGFTPADVLYSPLPLFYSMGLLRGVLSVLLTGASIVLRDRFSVSAYWEDVRAYGATVGHTVFALPQMLASAEPTDRDADNPLRCMFNAQHDPAFEKRFGVRLIEGYGLTEAGNAIYSRLDEPAVPGSCGRVSPEWDVLLADPDGFPVPDGEPGEILLRPRLPHRIMLGYLHKAEANARATRDLWLHTGDLARRDAEGFYYFHGRLKDMIRRRGQNISGWEVEQMLLEHPDVADAAAVAYPSEVGEDDLRVVLVAREGATLDLAEVAAFCARRMPDYMTPRYLETVGELPKTPSGRVEKYKLADAPLGAGAHDLGPGRKRP